jgi:hypothetical protein
VLFYHFLKETSWKSMNLSDQITINLPFISIVIAVSAIVFVTAILIFYIIKLNKKVNLLTPKYGFGGKNIAAVALLAFLVGAAPLFTIIALNTTEIRRYAQEIETVVINANVLDKTESEVTVGFSVVPMENGVAWKEDNYTVVWEVTGPTGFTFLEQDVNRENPSYITRVLSSGNYEVKVKVTGENFEVEDSSNFTF